MNASVEELSQDKVAQIVEAALLAAEGPITVDGLYKLFLDGELGAEEGRKKIRQVLKELQANEADRGIELVQVASGYRFQARQDLSPWVSRLWDEKPPRYTRALLETLAIIVYKQPVSRGDIEQIRGVGVSQNIMRTLLEREWIKIVGQREAPGRPAIYGTTKAFLDYFGVRSLDQLPPLDEIRELVEPVLDPDAPAAAQPSGNGGAEESQDEAAAEQQDEPVGEQNEGVSEQPAAAELSAAENADTETTPEANSADPSADQGDDPETPQQAQ
jgi:segregation and condensation protein B